jgi:ferrous-iron efflux pump FieF
MERLDSLRIRSAGAKVFVDMRLTLNGGLSFTEAHRIASLVEQQVSEIVPGADALVHVNPSKERSSRALPEEEISDILSEHGSLSLSHQYRPSPG